MRIMYVLLVVMVLCPAVGYCGLLAIAEQTYSMSGPGGILIQLMLLSLGSYLLSYIAIATQHSNIAAIIKVCALLGSIAVVAYQAWSTVVAVTKAIGVGL